MTGAAATPLGLGLALLGAVLASVLVVASADGAGARAGAYLAPSSACAGADDSRASLAVQRKAVVCLVNWARRRQGLSPLSAPSSLVRAATLKGRIVASCRQLSHTPCGRDAAGTLRTAGYRYAWFGENLFAGTWGHVSARQVVDAWLASPPHRVNMLRPQFRHLGAARVRADGILGSGQAAVWVATLASPR